MNMHLLLGQNEEVEKKFKQCQKEIESLKKKISVKTQGRDVNGLKSYSSKNPIPGNIANPRSRNFRKAKTLPGHFGKIYALHWGSNSEDIVSASQDGKLLVWNTMTGNKKIAIPLRSAWVMTCAYSDDGKFVASGGLDNLCSIFNIKDSVGWEVKQPHRELQHHEGYLSCCRFVDNNRILTASGDASCLLWDIEQQKHILSFVEHTGDVESVSVFPEKSIFVSGAIDATAKVWDYRTNNKCVRNFKGHTSDINSVQWFPDGNAFVSGSDDASARLFDLRAQGQVNKYSSTEIYSTITSVDFTKSGYYLISGYDEEPYCIVWNTITGQQLFGLEHPTRASCLQTAPNGNCIATGCWDKILRIWA